MADVNMLCLTRSHGIDRESQASIVILQYACGLCWHNVEIIEELTEEENLSKRGTDCHVLGFIAINLVLDISISPSSYEKSCHVDDHIGGDLTIEGDVKVHTLVLTFPTYTVLMRYV